MNGLSQLVTEDILSLLWHRYGSEEFLAEWSGVSRPGSKVSQRFWEYLRVVQLAELDPTSVVLDIGGGTGFFANLVAPFVSQVMVVDPAAEDDEQENMAFIKGGAYDDAHCQPDEKVSHITCISVLEHIPPADRIEMVRRLNGLTTADTLVFTYDYHPVIRYFDHQLTMQDAGVVMAELSNFYCDLFEASPTHAPNAFNQQTPLWYPVVLRFRRRQS